MSETSTDTGLLEQVTSLVERCQGMSLVVFEDTEVFQLDDRRVRTLEALLDVGLAVTGQIMERYEEAADTEPVGLLSESDSLRAIGEQISAELASREVSDLAFVGYSQIRAGLERLRAARGNDDPWVVMAQADTAHRHLAKALIALESALREFHGLPTTERQWVSIEDSLEIRRVYGQFRRAIARLDEDPTMSGSRAGLESAARTLAILHDRAIYPYLRIDDRRQIRQLRKRIAACLVASADRGTKTSDGQDEGGRELWQDLVAFAELIQQVNDRQELREHDGDIAAQAVSRLAVAEPDRRPATKIIALLGPLLGRDPALDQLLLTQPPPPASAWLDTLSPLRASLRASAGSSARS